MCSSQNEEKYFAQVYDSLSDEFPQTIRFHICVVHFSTIFKLITLANFITFCGACEQKKLFFTTLATKINSLLIDILPISCSLTLKTHDVTRLLFIPNIKKIKATQTFPESSLGERKTFPSNSILMMLIDSQVLATIYFFYCSRS